jgi:hypothetical protein
MSATKRKQRDREIALQDLKVVQRIWKEQLERCIHFGYITKEDMDKLQEELLEYFSSDRSKW